MRKIAGNSLRASPRSGRPSSATPADGTLRPPPSGARDPSKSAGSKLLLLPVDLRPTQPPEPEAIHAADASDAAPQEPVVVERRARPPLGRRRPEASAGHIADHVEPVIFKTRVAEPLPASRDGEADPELISDDDVELARPDLEPQPAHAEAPTAESTADEPSPPDPVRRPAPERRQAKRPAAEPEPPLVDETAGPPGEVHFGTLLRRARERSGLALADVADKTRISPRWIRALEDAQLDILPAPVFVSGYLRTYARLVGLDGQDLLERYHALARKRAQAQVPHERGFTVRRHGQQVLIPPWLLFLILLGVTGGVLAVLWLTNTFWRR